MLLNNIYMHISLHVTLFRECIYELLLTEGGVLAIEIFTWNCSAKSWISSFFLIQIESTIAMESVLFLVARCFSNQHMFYG